MNLRPYIEKFARRLAEVEAALSDPKLPGNPAKLQELSREYARLKDLTTTGERYLKVQSDLAEHAQSLQTEPAESEMAQLAREEIALLQPEEQSLARRVQMGLAPPDPADSRNTIIEIRAGAGGSESALFAADLFRMYTRYAASRGWKAEGMDSSPSDLGGFKEIIFGVTGVDVFKRLKYESGVHRVQRVPATEAQGRIHTSTATVAVLPEAQEVDLEIRPEDLEINVCRASGKGGQGVNTTDSAVRITHLPSGIVVTCQNERSQLQNKTRAMQVLAARLQVLAEEQAVADASADRASQIRTVDRSERIRTYNFPENRITDHRIGFKAHNLDQVLDGDLDALFDALSAADKQSRLQQA